MRTSAWFSATTQQRACDAIIALHSTARGPGAGGCRFWNYASSDDALTDALRLSRGMSYKNAMADLPLGGGKASCCSMRSSRNRRTCCVRWGASCIRSAVRMSLRKMSVRASRTWRSSHLKTPYVSGLPRTAVDADGNPAPKTALGVYLGTQGGGRISVGPQRSCAA